jgi:NADPH:quinone reductase-like Zn-dependent oxidoreductase
VKAAIVETAGSYPVYGDFAEPVVGPGRELVELVAAGIHPVVRSLAAGRHYGSTNAWPLIPGVDAVARAADGALVYTGYVEPPYGTIAERMAVPASMRLELPANADPVAVAAGLNPGLSSWMPLRNRLAEVHQLGTVLVLGVTGIAGALAVQNAFALGAARVVGVGRNPERLERAAANGAVTVPLSGDRGADAAAIVDALAGDAPGLVLDFVWGAPAEAAFAALGRGGLEEDTADVSYIEIGSLAGADASLPASLLRSRRIRISGSGAGSASISELVGQVPVYMGLIADGSVQVPTRTFPLSRVRDAWAAAAGEGGPASRAVIVPD